MSSEIEIESKNEDEISFSVLETLPFNPDIPNTETKRKRPNKTERKFEKYQKKLAKYKLKKNLKRNN